MGRAASAILDVPMPAATQPLSSDQIVRQANHASGSGGFNNSLGRLRSLEAAVGCERDGGTRANEVFSET